MNKTSKFWKTTKNAKLIIIMLMATLLISACGSQSDSSNKSICNPASQRQVENIRSGVQDIASNNNIGSAWAIKSGDFDNVWFIAAQITGPGINEGSAVGLWAISGDPNNPGLTYSVNSIATAFSSWGDGTKTSAQLSQFDDGAQEALECARSNP